MTCIIMSVEREKEFRGQLGSHEYQTFCDVMNGFPGIVEMSCGKLESKSV